MICEIVEKVREGYQMEHRKATNDMHRRGWI